MLPNNSSATQSHTDGTQVESKRVSLTQPPQQSLPPHIDIYRHLSLEHRSFDRRFVHSFQSLENATAAAAEAMAAIAFPNASSFHRNSLVCQSAVPAQGQWRRSDFNGRVLKMQRRRVSVRAESSDLNSNPKPKPSKKKSEPSEGVFAPLVVLTRNIIGKKRFNQLRGKAIALHSQVITEFCKSIGADSKQRQGLIRLAKKNGEKLGFLA